MGWITMLVPLFSSLIERIFPDKEKQDQAKLEMQRILNDAAAKQAESEARIIEASTSVIKAETESDSWMAKNWRPFLMFVIMSLIVYNWMLAPILQSIGLKIMITPVPQDMWTLLTVGLGGYVFGKSGEKMMGLYADAKKDVAQSNTQTEVAKFDNDRFYNVLKSKVFKQGLSQDQVDAINEALKEGNNGR